MPTILLSKIYPKGSALKNLRVGSTDVKYVKRGDGKLFYDTLKSTTYGKPSITLAYPTSSTSAAGGTTSPSSFSYSQSWYYTGHSGNTYSQTNKTSGATVEYSISGTGASINASTGVVTWASRGTSYASGTRSATVTVKVTLNSQSNTATFVVKLAKNQIKAITDSNASGGTLTAPATYSAKAETKSVANKTAASCSTATVTFESGSSGSITISSYGSVSGPVYSWKSNLTYFTLTSSNAASIDVSSVSRGTSYSTSTRSATITRTAAFTITIDANNSSTGSALTHSPKPTATCTCTLAKNVITKVAITVNAGALTNPDTYAAGGATKSVANKTAASASATLTYSSDSTRNTSNSDYGTWTGPTYSWTSNQSYATLTSANSTSLNVTMPNRTTTTGSSRSATITRKASYTYTLSSSYNNASLSAVNNSANATATVTQLANNVVSTETYYTIEMDSNPHPNSMPIPQAGIDMALEATAYKQTGTTYTSGSVSYSGNTYLTVTVKVYINNVLLATYTVTHGAAFPLWWCPANTSNLSRTIKFVASIAESTQTATFENTQLGSSDNYVFQTGGLNMIGYSTAASGFTADIGINSTKNGTPLSFAVTSAASWLSGTISLPSGFPYGTHLFTVRASANTGSSRSGTITITLTGSGMTLTYNVTQLGV